MITDKITPRTCRMRLPSGLYCEQAAETVDYVCGFRCVNHPPRWNASYAKGQHADGRPEVADAYRRTMIALLRDRISTRSTTTEQEAA